MFFGIFRNGRESFSGRLFFLLSLVSRQYGTPMIDMIREYLANEFEGDVFDSSDAAGDTTDRVLTFTFRRVTHTVVVTGAILRQPPRDIVAFLTDRDTTLADIVMMATGQPVIVEPSGFRVLETPISRAF